ncbi:hypothetical protein HZH66_012169 [Vespula vulgaris]|uniref:Uncharacterized protein n=1 Tax=Vespula vulgaris TaxID=7454 RepID=A0A834MW13_VESVU|nr:hypothetical protein HZH66_012169 [Vespula vulgaris]
MVPIGSTNPGAIGRHTILSSSSSRSRSSSSSSSSISSISSSSSSSRFLSSHRLLSNKSRELASSMVPDATVRWQMEPANRHPCKLRNNSGTIRARGSSYC